MIDPLIKVGSRPDLHFSGQPTRKLVLFQESENELSEQILGFVGQRPIEIIALVRITLRIHAFRHSQPRQSVRFHQPADNVGAIEGGFI